MNELSLFSGYGGLSLALKLTGIKTRTVAYVEWEKYPQEIIKARIKDKQEGKFGLDDAPLFGDISAFRGEQFRGVVDIITAGFPCPPFSQAGLQRGAEDPRNKWPDTLRVIREVAPRYVLLENVPGISNASRKRGTPSYGGVVVGELAEAGYDCFWQIIGADDVGASHRRKRWLCFGVANTILWGVDEAQTGRANITRGTIVTCPSSTLHRNMADSECLKWGNAHGYQPRDSTERTRERQSDWIRGSSESLADSSIEGLEGVGANDHKEGWQESNVSLGLPSGAIPTWPPGPNESDEWGRILAERPDLAPALTKETESNFRGVVDGRTHRVDELKALGNGVVPAVVAQFLKQLMR